VRDEYLDLPLALPLRLGDDGVEVPWLEMWGEQPHRGEVQGTLGQQIEDGGEPSTRTRSLDAVVCGVLGQTERPRAVAEERAEALAEVEPPGVELGEVCDELDRGLALFSGQFNNPAEELRVRQPGRCRERPAVRSDLTFAVEQHAELLHRSADCRHARCRTRSV
jgi:hypothetical protein